jgi:hypothetical protein
MYWKKLAVHFAKAKGAYAVHLKQSGWMLLIHSDFLWNTPLAATIKHYNFWDCSANEALFLSEKEEVLLVDIVKNIQREYHSNLDKYTKKSGWMIILIRMI